MAPQWHVKHPSHSAKSAGGKLHLNTHTPLTQRSQSGLAVLLSRHRVETYQETSWHATCQENIRPHSSQLAEPLWTDPGIMSGISDRELITTSKKKKKKRRRGLDGWTFSQKPRKQVKTHHHNQNKNRSILWNNEELFHWISFQKPRMKCVYVLHFLWKPRICFCCFTEP